VLETYRKGEKILAFNFIMQMATSHVTKALNPNPSVIELGNQRFRFHPEILDSCSIIAQRSLRKPLENVWDFFEDLGFEDYCAIDLNDSLRAVPMDLNFNLKEHYNFTTQYDLVTNNGTGEHIFDQKLVFENMHNLCKVGGVMLCILPFGPWINHGFYNFHPMLWRDLAAANNYEWLFMWIAQNTGHFIDTELKDWAFFEQKKIKAPISKLEEHYYSLTEEHNVSIVAAYRKIKDETFVVPLQGRYVNDANSNIRYHYKNPDTRQSNHTYDYLSEQNE